ncbi:MAG: hypothetical protein MR384_09120 [Lachnospiraceae bacterium]|nr:hypothetical protein [Lachnospiraceae bacterium]
MSYSKDAQKRYSKKTKTFAIKYTPNDIMEMYRLKTFLEVNGISANAYIKSVIKEDLDNKGIPYPDND